MQIRRVPYTITSFEKLVLEKFYYVDKTQYIELLEKYNCPIFLRPRRFGKSLFTETLRWYYDIKAKDRFQELFGNLYIGKHPTARHNSYFFLKFDFSGMGVTASENTDEIKRIFDATIGTELWEFLNYYSKELQIDQAFINEFDSLATITDAAWKLKKIMGLVEKANGKIYIAIDEYDNLTNAMALLYQYAPVENNEYLNILKKGGFFRAFFETIKKGIGRSVDKVYITGILPITIADMNSGFNVAEWVTFEPELINMLGITQTEFDTMVDTIYEDHAISVSKAETKRLIKEYYNGYRFLPNAEAVYNPMMTLYFLRNLINNNTPPSLLSDSNIRVDYNQIAFIFGNNVEERNTVIEEITSTKKRYWNSGLNVSFDMQDFKKGSYITEGLYYLGVLTYSHEDDYLKVPNIVTYEMVLTYFERIMQYRIDGSLISSITKAYKTEGNVSDLIAHFFELVIKPFPGDFFKNVNESFYHGLLYHILNTAFQKDKYEVFPEFNMPDGTVDLFLRSLPNAKVTCPLNDLFEIKRVPKGSTDTELEAQFEKTKAQALKHKTGEYAHWRGVAVCFRGNVGYKMEVM